MRVKINFNQNIKQEVLQAAFGDTMLLLGIEFTKAITSPVWAWTDGAMRDIVNVGFLRDSQQPPVEVEPGRWMFVWTAEYAAAVHEGAQFRSGYKMPARPWTQYAMENFNTADVFARLVAVKS